MTADLALIEFAERVHGAAFAWGRTDCWSLVRRAIRAAGLPIEYPPYHDETEALRALRRWHPDRTLDLLGAQRIDPMDAVTGDVLAGHAGSWPAYHVVIGRQVLSSTFDGPHLGRVRMVRIEAVRDLCDRAWRMAPCRK